MAPLLLLTPEIYSANGGIQMYMRRLAEILAAYRGRNGPGVSCLSLLDAPSPQPLHDRPISFHTLQGASGDKIGFLSKAIALSKREKPKIAVVGHHGILPIAWLLKKLWLLDQYVLVLHGIEAWKKIPWLDRVATRGAAAIVATTHFTAREFCRENDLPESRITIIPLAVGDEVLPSEAGVNSHRATSNLEILSVGRITSADRYKGFDMLVQGVGQAKRDGAGVHLKVVGSGDDLPYVREVAENSGLSGSVEFLGSVSDSDLSRCYRECDVFVMPSKKEGFGIVYLEAMRYAKPCIGGNHGGVPEVIDHGVNGFLVEHGQVAQLSKALMELWRDPELRLRMGRNAAEKVRNHFLASHMRNGWFALLDRLINTNA
jgi:phosphatidylinositol alpha-1,6-mannosyltransferase